MLGAIIGDIVGSTREFDNIKTEDFELVPQGSKFTDDTVMTLAVAKWLMEDPSHGVSTLVQSMKEVGLRHIRASYGSLFRKWLLSPEAKPYGSFGNGSAMRVSPVGMYASSLEEALELAHISAAVTHNHPEGIKGAQAIAACVYLRRIGSSAKKIKEYVERAFGYDLSVSLDTIRPFYYFDVSCQGSVPIAIMAFLERSRSIEKALRLAISMGGDSDTIACMTCSISMAKLGGKNQGMISKEDIAKCRALLTPDLLELNDRFEEFISNRHKK